LNAFFFFEVFDEEGRFCVPVVWVCLLERRGLLIVGGLEAIKSWIRRSLLLV
jgi:hypothetical protein